MKVNGDGPELLVREVGEAATAKPGMTVWLTIDPERAIAVADMNRDGRLDIIACHEALGTFIYLNQGKGQFAEGQQISGADAVPYSLVAADLDGDGAPEIIVGFIKAPSVIFWNDGRGRQFTTSTLGDGLGGTYGLAVADLNHDGLMDIVAARSDAPSLVCFQLRSTPSKSP